MVLPIFVACAIVALSDAVAQQKPHIELRFQISDELSNGIALRCGIDSAATDGLDLALGEYPLPGHPPDGFHAAWEIVTDDLSDLSYTDFRPYPDTAGDHFAAHYDLNVSPQYTRGQMLIFRWMYPLPRGIDSVVVTDRLGGQLVNLRFGSNGADTIAGNYAQLERFIVRVYYTPSRVTSVTEQPFDPVPILSGRELYLSWHLPIRGVVVYDLSGQGRAVPYIGDGELLRCSLDGLSCGWYLLVVTTPDGQRRSVPILIN
ncbi:MAG: hypothetical protein N3B17_08855 [Chlorobi bacterium]|nr:hypothetical protein [Chlorobiota bacterium]